MKISVLLTCHNRQDKTESCLRSLIRAVDLHNKNHVDKIHFDVFLTDDGCTDGTVDVVQKVFPNNQHLHILQGDGDLYWAGGMRYSWREAIKRHDEWDYYLLLNDDTEVMENVFEELIKSQEYSLNQFGKKGLISGITCSKDESMTITYGGSVWKNRFLATRSLLKPSGHPQPCDLTNANILFVHNDVVSKLGIFYEGYRHGLADYDYSINALKKGFPVILTANICGRCDRDHLDVKERAKKVISMSFKQRKQYFKNPLHSSDDYLLFVRRVSPIRYPFVWFGRAFNLYFPKVYYRISGIRS